MYAILVECPSCREHVTTVEDDLGNCPSCGAELEVTTRRERAEPEPEPAAAADVTSQWAVEEREHDRGPSKTYVATIAVSAALAGTLLWSAVAIPLRFEVSVLAWAIGGWIGVAAAWARQGGDRSLAAACCVLTLLSVFGGKWIAAQSTVNHAVAQFRATISESAYDKLRTNAEAYAALSDVPSVDQVRQFMFDRGLHDAPTPPKIPAAAVAAFRVQYGRELQTFAARAPSFETWQDDIIHEAMDDNTSTRVLKERLGPVDVFFMLLGMATACWAVMRQAETSPSA